VMMMPSTSSGSAHRKWVGMWEGQKWYYYLLFIIHTTFWLFFDTDSPPQSSLMTLLFVVFINYHLCVLLWAHGKFRFFVLM
jgi:hypothetical protein